MTRSRTPRTQAPPLVDTLRSALAGGWHSLAALDALAGGTASTRRARVHAALAELAAAGVAREERMGSTGAEVRLAPVTMTLVEAAAIVSAEIERVKREAFPPAINIDCPKCNKIHLSNDCPLNAEDREAARAAVEDDDAPCEPSSPVEAADAPMAHEPGPSSRCAVCARPYARHADAAGVPYAGPEGHAFAIKSRGRPRVADRPPVDPIPDAAPAVLPRRKASKTRGTIVDVAAGRVERASDAAGAEPETSRGASDGLDTDTIDAIREVIDTAPPSVRERVRARRAQAASAPVKPAPCRPPACHADDIHEPARVRGFARPLCERHRRWVEGAGGTVATAADAAALHAGETV